MKIGYYANSDDLLHGADRRRFVHFANKENVLFEKFNFSKKYDLVIISVAANFNKVLLYKKKFNKVKFIFDYCDDLLSDPIIKKIIRPFYEVFKWKSLQNLKNYNNLVINLLSISDAIICGSIEQKKKLLRFNKSIFVIPDFVVIESFFKKDNFELIDNEKVNILWEGLSGGCRKIAKDLFKIAASLDRKVSLNFVTDPKMFLIGDRYLKIDTEKFLKKLSKKYGVEIKFWSWTKNNLNKAVECSDIGIIFIPKNDKTMQNKPENKLVLLSSFCLPVLVSNTPSYKRYLYSAGGKELYDISLNFNKSNFENIFTKKSIRALVGKHLYRHAIKEYSEKIIIGKWKYLLNFISN